MKSRRWLVSRTVVLHCVGIIGWFPANAAQYCLETAGISLTDVDYLVFYDNPLIKFERLLETYLNYAPHEFRSFLASMPVWLKDKLYLKTTLRKAFAKLGDVPVADLPQLLFSEHHRSHAASDTRAVRVVWSRWFLAGRGISGVFYSMLRWFIVGGLSALAALVFNGKR